MPLGPGFISFAARPPDDPDPPIYDSDFQAVVREMVAGLPKGAVVAELGAGANPLLIDSARISEGVLTYLRVDISQDELDKCDTVGEPIVCDLSASSCVMPYAVDLAVSRMLAEHVLDGQVFLRNVYDMLKPGGHYVQVSPVLGALPFLVNRMLPVEVARSIVQQVRPAERRRGVFPARYSWCRGPTARQLARIGSLGLEVVAARGYFGHGYYGRFMGALDRLERRKSAWLARHPAPALCAFAVYVMRRPE